jgi:mycofactocin system glycosyltransferase
MTLPHGFTVRLTTDLLAAGSGTVLVGGSPLTAMRLSGRARQLFDDDTLTVSDQATEHLAERLLATNLGLPQLDSQAEAAAGDLTVVIPVRDRPAQLDRALAALAPLTCIVVDDASHETDAVASVAGRHGARLLRLSTNVGPAAARNAGARQARTPYVAFVDSDVEVDALSLLRLTRHFADPAVCLVGPRVTGIARSSRPRWFEKYDAAASSLTLGLRAASVGPGSAVAWLPSACLVARTDVVLGRFDESLRVGEDVDLVWRLVDDGHRVRYDPAVEAVHDTRSTMRAWLGRKAFYGAGSAILAERHGDRLAPAVLTPSYAVAGAALLLRRRWSAPVAAIALAAGTRAVHRALPESPGRPRVAALLAARGLGWAVRQESALLLRHWWPAAAVGAITSRQVRRAIATALVVDTAVGLVEHRRAGVHPIALVVGRRLDDAAYGAGLWWGAANHRSFRALCPRRPRSGRGPLRLGRHSSLVGTRCG